VVELARLDIITIVEHAQPHAQEERFVVVEFLEVVEEVVLEVVEDDNISLTV
jgi:hypothetical protein